MKKTIKTLSCSLRPWPQASVKWFKNGAAIGHRDKYRSAGKDALRIDAMELGDQGVFQCIASTERQSAQASVHLVLGGNSISFFAVFIFHSFPIRLKAKKKENSLHTGGKKQFAERRPFHPISSISLSIYRFFSRTDNFSMMKLRLD